MFGKRAVLTAVILSGVAAVACDKPEAPKDDAAKVAVAPPKPSATVDKPVAPRAPDILVDEQGAFVGGDHFDLTKPDGPKKLLEKLAPLPIAGATLTVTALRNAKTVDVEKTIDALAQQKAGPITIKTFDRDKKEQLLPVTPDRLAPKVPDCTVVMGITKDRSSASWSVKGGTANKYPKGMAGPDMTATTDGVKKAIGRCDSPYFAIGSVDAAEWGVTFDVASIVTTASPPLTATKAILLREEPVAGRPVKIGAD